MILLILYGGKQVQDVGSASKEISSIGEKSAMTFVVPRRMLLSFNYDEREFRRFCGRNSAYVEIRQQWFEKLS